MARKVNPVTKLILLYESLNEVEQTFINDYLRAKQVKVRPTAKRTKRQPAKTNGVDDARTDEAAS